MSAAIGIESFVVIQDNRQEPAVSILQAWLEDRGHHVRMIATAEDAIAAAGSGRTDLLVLSLADVDDQSAAIDRLGLMPGSSRPRHVAILSDLEPDVTLRRRLPGVKLHLLGHPVHTLGLLNIARRITAGKN